MSWSVVEGDCLDVMAAMPACSVDAIVTDPPYGLGFMGREWDALPPGLPWARECLRVLKPGGHLLAFGGTRTYHRLAVAIEDGGFEIRDTIAWMYGSGFPKSLDVSKAIDKAAGAEREVVAASPYAGRRTPGDFGLVNDDAWQPSEHGVTSPATPDAERWNGWGTALKPAHEPIVVARKPLVGTVAANVLAHGTGALNIDACRIEAHDDQLAAKYASVQGTGPRSNSVYGVDDRDRDRDGAAPHALGRWPANVVLDEAAAGMLDEQTGELHAPVSNGNGRTTAFASGVPSEQARTFTDSGGASRFFYVAKTSSYERSAGLGDDAGLFATGDEPDRNDHPTVKPISLMRWLVTLVTPPGGLVLDPFAGSGSTGCACVLEGFSFKGIEREPAYVAIARGRIGFWALGEVAA